MKLPSRSPPVRTETTVKSEIRRAINRIPGCIAFPNATGEADIIDKRTGNKYHVQFGLAVGSSDIIACCWGKFVAIEVKKKKPSGKPSAHFQAQLDFIARVESYGGIGGGAWDVESALEIVERARPVALCTCPVSRTPV